MAFETTLVTISGILFLVTFAVAHADTSIVNTTTVTSSNGTTESHVKTVVNGKTIIDETQTTENGTLAVSHNYATGTKENINEEETRELMLEKISKLEELLAILNRYVLLLK